VASPSQPGREREQPERDERQEDDRLGEHPQDLRVAQELVQPLGADPRDICDLGVLEPGRAPREADERT
jgi:hypothetical protein